MVSTGFSQDSLKFEVNFTRKLNKEISLYRLRERTSLKVEHFDKTEAKAKIIFTVMKGNEVIYQTNIDQAPNLVLTEGENYFEGDILNANEASHIILNLDNTIRLKYDLFYVKGSDDLKHRTLVCAPEISNEDETVGFVAEEIIEEGGYQSFARVKNDLKTKFLDDPSQINLDISESAVAYFQLQQGLSMVNAANKVSR